MLRRSVCLLWLHHLFRFNGASNIFLPFDLAAVAASKIIYSHDHSSHSVKMCSIIVSRRQERSGAELISSTRTCAPDAV
jgi:hypothetical protein